MLIGAMRASLMTTLIVVAPGIASPQTPPAPQNPACEAPVWGDHVTAFATRMDAYVTLRHQLEMGLPQPSAHALAERIRTARARAKQGDILTPELSVEIQKSLRREIDAHTWKVIMDDNPGELPSQVNAEYREGRPLSTMPPNILAALPKLPEDIEYRFVERHLILLDTRARLILDRIPYAIRLADSTGSCR